jgi:tripartite-type tricarboxylate transporter receptor subunit TctC
MIRLPAVFLACALATSANAADWNCETIRLVVPFPAGGAADVGARLIADSVGTKLGKTFVVENRPGASGNIGTEYVINAPKNGCTVLINSTSMATFPASYSKLRFDPFKDLAVVSALGTTPTFIVTATPVADLNELQNWSKTRPNGLSYGSSGYGLFAHLAVEEIAKATGANYIHVPYRGGGQATTDMIASRLDFGAFAAGTVLPFVAQKQLKVIAVVQPNRSPLSPDVKTTSEQGLPDMDASIPFLFYVPGGTPASIIERLNSGMNEAAARPEIRAKLLQLGFEPLKIGPKDGAELLRKTSDQWTPVIQRLGVKID